MRRLAHLLLALALLAGWQAALLHPLEHLDEHGELVHLDHSHDEVQLDCYLVDALAACAPSTCRTASALRSAGGAALPVDSAPRRAEPVPFLAQGPPRSRS
jgi:hypothetical protein